MAVAVSGGGAVAVAGLTKRFFNHIQKDFLIDVWVYRLQQRSLQGKAGQIAKQKRVAPPVYTRPPVSANGLSTNLSIIDQSKNSF